MLSVIVPTHESERILVRTLACLVPGATAGLIREVILADAGSEGLPTLEVAERLLERAPGVTRLMDRLERRGLVTRRGGEDRRQVFCAATDSGAAIVGQLRPTVALAEEAVVSCLNPHELGVLNHFLNRICAATAVDD